MTRRRPFAELERAPWPISPTWLGDWRNYERGSNLAAFDLAALRRPSGEWPSGLDWIADDWTDPT